MKSVGSHFILMTYCTLLIGGCTPQKHAPSWVAEANQITIGMTRTEAEALLPTGAKIDLSFGSSGNHRDFYSVGKNWRVTLVYRAPWETNMYITMFSPDGQKITTGPSQGFMYNPTPDQKVIAGPFIERIESGTDFNDPYGSFHASKQKP